MMECEYHGITYDPNRKNWKARIHYEGKEQYIGRWVQVGHPPFPA
jgi:hypothetical protein